MFSTSAVSRDDSTPYVARNAAASSGVLISKRSQAHCSGCTHCAARSWVAPQPAETIVEVKFSSFAHKKTRRSGFGSYVLREYFRTYFRLCVSSAFWMLHL